jgi:D-alanyl-lipoteichoic acid acyltransferase DltB (MBOAT superfamily)
LRHWLTLAQLALVVSVAHVYQIESQAFIQVVSLSAAGFVVSISLDDRLRLPFFVILSFLGIFLVLGVTDGAYLVALGMALIGIAHLSMPVIYRAGILVILALVLATFRSGTGDTPWSGALWPILGSMFMFRMILYVRALRSGQVEKGIWNTLAYFFMLPNVAFPLFPVIDYHSFKKNYFDRDDKLIYEQGMLWIARGLMHLMIYRFVYHYVLNDPRDVVQLSDLVQFMLGTFLLYLRVSGQFHVIVGVLHLFGFRLPETHKLYYLAHGFTELWRRINIYWTEFMMNTVFYPAYFKVKNLGPTLAVTLATAAVFVVTWLLHSYQWFWLRGGFPIHVQDILFWGILGSLVIAGALRELNAKKTVKRQDTGWSARSGLKAAITFCIFCFLWSLWSSESFGQWLWMLGSAANADTKGILLLLATFAIIMFFGGWNWEKIQSSSAGEKRAASIQAVRTATPMAFLLLLALPPVQNALAASLNFELKSLMTTRLNAQDAAARHRGYYEQLDIRQRLNAPQAGAIEDLRQNWKDPAAAGIIRERTDILSRDLHPNVNIVWNGNNFSTNEFGMRDQSYAMEKPPGTLRIALLGPSHVMGNGVSDDETFETIVENRLNRELSLDGVSKFEVLNFAVDGYALPQQYALLVDRVFDFSPDIVIVTQYHQGSTMTESYLRKILQTRAEIPEKSLKLLLAEAGLDDPESGDVAIPFESWRGFAERLGLSPRMPHAELTGRIHQVSEDVNDWAVASIASAGAANEALTIMVLLNEVLDIVPEGIPNNEAIVEAGIPVIDLLNVYSGYDQGELRVASWDEHPNALGHELIANNLYEQLIPYVRSYAMSNNAQPKPED